eukprot:scaffold7549_cov111-Isochrysis_galbana.AAC.5
MHAQRSGTSPPLTCLLIGRGGRGRGSEQLALAFEFLPLGSKRLEQRTPHSVRRGKEDGGQE